MSAPTEAEIRAAGMVLRDRDICRLAIGRARVAGLMACPASDALFRTVWTPNARGGLPSLRDVAAALRRNPSTAGAAFHRAAVRHGFRTEPAARPAALLYYAWLVRVAAVLEDPRVSLTDASDYLGCSSPQTFGRSLQTWTGLGGPQWRAGRTGYAELERFLAEAVPLQPMLADVRLWPRAARPIGLAMAGVG